MEQLLIAIQHWRQKQTVSGVILKFTLKKYFGIYHMTSHLGVT